MSEIFKILQQSLDELNIEISSKQQQDLVQYISLLQKWNKTYNLTAIKDTKEILIKHIIDCIAPLTLLRDYQDKHIKILDVGSGAGLPSIVWNIINPNWSIYSIDCVQKKIAFQKQVKLDLKLVNFYPIHSRIQDIKQQDFDIITARAYADNNNIINETKNLLNNGFYFLLKGKEYEKISEYNAKYIDIEVPFLNAKRHIMQINIA